MKYPTILEFKDRVIIPKIVYDPDSGKPPIFPRLTYDSPRLNTAAHRAGLPAGSDKAICKTVNGIVRINYVGGDPGWIGIANAALMCAYGGKTAVIQEHSTGPVTLGFETTGLIDGNNPVNSNYFNLYSAASMSGGAYGFDLFSSFSNQAEQIFLRVIFLGTRDIKASPVFEVSGVLLAADPE